MKIINKTKNTILAKETIIADTSFARMKGLLGRTGLTQTEALVIKPCNSIHTFFMRFVIDVVFVDGQNKIIATLSDLGPWRLSPIYWSARFVVEFPAGVIANTQTEKGDEIALI